LSAFYATVINLLFSFVGPFFIRNACSGKVYNEIYKRKQEIYNSRIKSTQLIGEKLREQGKKIKGFICASAIGIYGPDTADNWVDEDSPEGQGFLVDVVRDWENSADELKDVAEFVSKIRIGIVLSDKGGALPKLITPVKFYAGAPLGSGKQFMSWIHINDLARMFVYLIENKLNGIFNGTAPEPVTNKEITKAIAKSLNRPLFLPNVPAFILKIIFGEMSEVLLGGNRVSSKKILKADFKFDHPSIQSALSDLI
jgi:hypothetical protein